MEESNYTLDENNFVGCGCAACQSGQPQVITSGQENTSPPPPGDPAYAPSGDAEPNEFANYLTHGYWQDTGGQNRSWAQDTVTYSISAEFTSAQKAGFKMAFDLWADVADIKFNEVSSGADMILLEGDDGRAYSSSTTSGTTILSNRISIDTNVSSWQNFNDLGDYALMTALHEIGHSLGLGHTGNYNGSATYNNDAQWANDSHQMTVMSYFSDNNVGSDHWNNTNVWQYSATPMLIDILAIQNIYGANYNTRNGDTTYGFNSNAARDQFDFSIDEVPIAIWDGGGIDTLDLSGYSTNQTITLEEGEFSSTGSMTNNIVIAYGTVIENAIGGNGNDRLYGNDANNILSGGAGNDTFFGSLGSDTINGGDDTDSLFYNYSISDFAFNFIDNVTVALSHVAQAFTDIANRIENFIFTEGTYSFAQLQGLYGSVSSYKVDLLTAGGSMYYIYSDEEGMITATTNDLGLNSNTNAVTFDHTRLGTTVTFLQDTGSSSLKFTGSDNNDLITIEGVHTNISVKMYALDGDDIITIATGGGDLIYGGDGNDIISTGDGNDRVYGDNGQDTLNGDAGRDKLYGGADNDIINGGADNDLIKGDEGDDTLNGDDGNDFIRGGIGADTINGGAGSDIAFGEEGDDTINGDDGSDRLYGEEGDDIILGNQGSDRLYGGDGADLLIGGSGKDYLYGGIDTDIDLFGFSADENGQDQIFNFVLGVDKINITDLLSGYDHGISDISDFVEINHVGASFEISVDRNGGVDSFQRIALVNTDILDSLDAQDLLNAGALIANQTLI